MVANPRLIEADAVALRSASRNLRALSQSAVIDAIVEWRNGWLAGGGNHSWMTEAAGLSEPFPFDHCRVSLEPLLLSLSRDEIERQILTENVCDLMGPPVIGHVIAGNTPLLAWTSVLRALLMRSASLVKLPSDPAAIWGQMFARTLARVSREMAGAVRLRQWPGGVGDCDDALAGAVDLMLVYGSNATVSQWASLCAGRAPLHDYGHRASIGVCSRAASDATMAGFARDVLVYDQGGCLSLHFLFCLGNIQDAVRIGQELAAAMTSAASTYCLRSGNPSRAARVRAVRDMARMEGSVVLEPSPSSSDQTRWTVVVSGEPALSRIPGDSVLTVLPIESAAHLTGLVSDAALRLQGLAMDTEKIPCAMRAEIEKRMQKSGVSYCCSPGLLQSPPFSWPQDGRKPLASLVLSQN